MATAESYLEEAMSVMRRAFPGGTASITWTSSAEARLHKKTITQVQKELRLLKKKISADRRSVSSEFTSQRVMIGKSFGAGVAAGLLGRRTMGRVNAVRRNEMRMQQLRAVAPYDQAAARLDAVLISFDSLKTEIDRQLLGGTANFQLLPGGLPLLPE
jgi:hypothetical protein